jgi:polysaccharide export outer membrane protein
MTVLTAVAVAGGFTYRAQTDDASILRKIDGHPVEGRVPRGMEVQPGDVINILERYF